MLEELEELNVALRDQHGISLRVRIGIHTGIVVAGEMGVRRDPGADGDRRRDAAHRRPPGVDRRAPDGGLISDATRDLVEGYFVTESLGAQQLKGVSRLIGVHRVLRATGAVGRLEVAGERRLTPLVGRDHELARLAQAWQQVKRGHGAIVHLTGEAGIGKSRIVRELLDRLSPQVGEAQIWRCSPHHRGTTLHPVIRYLERLLAVDAARPAAEQLRVLAEAVRGGRPAAGRGGADPGRTARHPGRARRGDRRISPRATSARRRCTSSRRCSSPIPARHPLLLVVEDLHWADPTTVELLHRIVADLAQRSRCCACSRSAPSTSRPGPSPSPVLELELGPLVVRACPRAGRVGERGTARPRRCSTGSTPPPTASPCSWRRR